jgi:hypothetical protein
VRRNPGSFHPRDVSAFAEGRRLREQAERHNRQRTRQRPPDRQHRPARLLGLSPAVVLLCWMLALGVFARAQHGAFGFVDPTPLLMIGAMTVLAAGRGRRAISRAPMRPPAQVATVAPPRRDLEWAGARDRFHALRSEYAAFECDPIGVLRLPALADVRVPSTARFVDAFAEAQALETDAFPGPEHGGRFVSAADRAERAWRAAKDAAERIRLSTLTPAERATVERVVKLLTTARDSDSEPERLAAYSRARSELAKLDQAGVLHVPLPAQAALDVAVRGALPS